MTSGQAQPHYIPPLGKIKAPRGRRVLRRHASALRFVRCARGVLFLGLTLLCACAAGPRLEPVAAPMQPGVTLAEAGVRLTLLPNTWSAYPGDLSRYYTPLEIQIENLLAEEVQVRYEDFLALDDSNHQYRAVPPGEVARAMSGSLRPVRPALPESGPMLVAGPTARGGTRIPMLTPTDGPGRPARTS
jgi:hypothetical protein